MRNNHMQPIVAYFSRTADAESHISPALETRVLGTQVKPPISHLEPAIDYLAQDKLAQDKLAQPVGPDQASSIKRVAPQPSLFSRLQQLWRNVITVNTEPQIREGVTSSGEPYWQVYDPVAQASHTFFDEEAVYCWLERRYYS
jgi:hypothetical protein